MSIYSKSKGKDGSVVEVPQRVVETRLTGFTVHLLVLLSSLFVPLLSVVPLAVVSGVFLYLGRKVMRGNLFIERCKKLFLEEKELDRGIEGETEQFYLGRWAVFRFTAFQGLCLAGLLALRSNPSTALVFPSVIGVLMGIRVKLIPKMFSKRELRMLDTRIVATKV